MDTVKQARELAAMAGIRVPPEREAALAAGLEAMRRITETLAAREYGDIEPAGCFRAPAPEAGQ